MSVFPGKYTDRINVLIADVRDDQEKTDDPSRRRNCALAITHLEDALLRLNPSALQPNPFRSRSAPERDVAP